jgi:cephalosporin-C deacetylase-like acetyl esterase
MKKLFAFLAVFSAAVLAAAEYYFDGTCDKDPLSYKSGETMTFTVTLKDKKSGDAPVTGRRVKWQRRGDDGITESGYATTDKPVVIKTASKKPGFVRVTVELLDKNGKPVRGARNSRFDGGACADANLLAMTAKPADFDSFWDGEYKKLIDTPYKTELKEVKSKDPKVKVTKFSISTLAGYANATGYILVPAGAKAKSLPIYTIFYGYGFGATKIDYYLAKKGNIVVQVTRQGEEPDREKSYYENLRKNECKMFGFRNNRDLYKNDFYNMIIRGQRALQYAETIPEWDGKTMIVQGGSMGGFQAVAAAALNKNVSKCIAIIPWMADLDGYLKHKRMRGWIPNWVEQLAYFDTVNLASRIKCAAQVEVGLGDFICPPSSGILLYRNLKCDKNLILRQNCGHSNVPYDIRLFQQRLWAE